jgi:hypothetical protein
MTAVGIALLLTHGVLMAQGDAEAKRDLTLAELRAGFMAPPPQARLRCYWWWLNGHTDKATITHDLEEMKAKGFGGALLVDANGANQDGNENVPPGPTFGSPAWVDLYTHALREADRLGLEITLNITSGWNLGGPDVKPEDASKLLTWSQTAVKGGQHVVVKLAAPAQKNGFYREIAVLAYPLHRGPGRQGQRDKMQLREQAAAAETGFSMPDATWMLRAGKDAPADTDVAEVQNISQRVTADGSLECDFPAGDWEVLRIGYTDSDARVSTSSGAWQGLAIDYLSQSAFDTYWEHTVEPLLADAKPFHSLKYLATDSWELGGTNWTDTFAAEFQRRRGYDPVVWLPVVAGCIVTNGDRSARFLTDLRRTVGDLVADNHYAEFSKRAAQHGLGVQAESGGPHGAPIDALETFRMSAVPQTEFWSENAHRAKDGERFFTKEGSSAANIYGKRFVAQEGETSIGPQWSESLATDLKPSFDMAITEGMNRLVWHEFTSSPASTGVPGQEYFAGTHLNPKVTWWDAGGAFFSYLNRVQFLMQQGTAVDDVLYFYGDNVPNFVRLKADDPAHVLPGYDYDVTDEDALLHAIQLDGKMLRGPSGVAWRALVMPKSGRISLVALERASAYVKGGGVLIGEAPTSPTGWANDAAALRFAQLSKAVWGLNCSDGTWHAFGAGTVFCGRNTHAALAAMHVLPDVEWGSAATGASHSSFDYVHRRTGAIDMYFVRNGSGVETDLDVTFRVKAVGVERWNAVTADMQRIPDAMSTDDGRTMVHVKLAPHGSAIYVFMRDARSDRGDLPSLQKIEAVVTKMPWMLSFQPNRGAPVTPVTLNELESWTASKVAGVRYFSGTATYTANIKAPALVGGEKVFLRVAGLHEVARVHLNGQDAGTVWAEPLELRVDKWLKPGWNRIEIEVTNLWPNRIIGDLQPGVTERYTETNITKYRADSPLLPSGLIGPLNWVLKK